MKHVAPGNHVHHDKPVRRLPLAGATQGNSFTGMGQSTNHLPWVVVNSSLRMMDTVCVKINQPTAVAMSSHPNDWFGQGFGRQLELSYPLVDCLDAGVMTWIHEG